MANVRSRCAADDTCQLYLLVDPVQPASLAAIAAVGVIESDLAQECQGYPHIVPVRRLQQVHAHIMHHLARGMPVTKAATHRIDQLVVVANQRRD
ncbi:hypothetical protein D3C78_1459260 [compost metagenome]